MDIPHSETVFSKRTPDDGLIRPKHVVKVTRRRRKYISRIVDRGIVCEKLNTLKLKIFRCTFMSFSVWPG